MRLIDADALLAFIDVGHLRSPNELCFSELMLKELIDKQPTIESPRWTPCAEGLPEELGRYIVTVKRTVRGKETEFTSERAFYAYLSGGYKWESTRYVDENIIAWMPKFKPAPYNPDQKEERQ